MGSSSSLSSSPSFVSSGTGRRVDRGMEGGDDVGKDGLGLGLPATLPLLPVPLPLPLLLLLLLPVMELLVFSTTTSRVTPSIHTSISWCRVGDTVTGVGTLGGTTGAREGAVGDSGGEIGEDGAGEVCDGFEDLRLVSRKLASGGRRRTPLRVEPSMAF